MTSRQTTVKQALTEFQRQTALTAVINYDYIAPGREVTLSSESLPAEEFLRQVLAGTGFVSEVVGRHLLIVPEPPRIDDGEGAIGAMWRDDEVDETVEMETLTFRAGNAAPQAGFMDNTRIFEKLDSRLRDTAVLARLDHISVTAASSPDGNTANNERLAVARALNTKGYLERRYPHIAPEKVQAFSVGEEWSGLRRLVIEDARTPDRDKVLAMLENLDDEVMRDSLRTLAGGRTWRYIASNLMPRLRGAAAVTLHYWSADYERRIDTVRVSNMIARGTGVQRVEISNTKPKPLPEPPPPVVIPEPEPRMLVALKTNLAADVAGAFNLEVEVPVGIRWSLAAEGVWSGRMFAAGTLEARRWWGDRERLPVMTGWFTGAYAGGGVYDLVWRSVRREGSFLHAGLSGGYAHTINRSGTLGMEYSLGLGYLRGGGGNRFVPTRARVSLVWMLGGRESEKMKTNLK
jgi:hypothetical protein